MARPLRLELAGPLYHITSRGDEREDICLSDEDRLAWLDTLAELQGRINKCNRIGRSAPGIAKSKCS